MAFDYDGTHDLETSLQDSFGEAIVHGMVVSNLASFVAKEMALSEEQCHNFAVAGMLHDIGKLRLRSYVYEEKEAKLNIDELRYVRLHPSLGYAILKEHGYCEFTVGVEDDNFRAIHVYQALGFDEILLRKQEEYQGDAYEYNLYLRR